jgi:hypothetical protein
MKSKQKSQKKQPPTGLALAEAVMQVARSLPATALATATQRSEMRKVVSRAPVAFVELVAKTAEEGGGHIAGYAVDATAMRAALTQVSQLRLGVAAARAVLRSLEQEVLSLGSGIAQRALSATTLLEALSRTPEGRIFAAKAAELRAAQKRGRRKAAPKPTAPAKPVTPAQPEQPAPAG